MKHETKFLAFVVLSVAAQASSLLCACSAPDHVEAPSSVEELPLDIPWSGRLQAIAVAPDNPDTVIAGADNGGLWKSTDGGERWARLPSFPVSEVIDVRFAPHNPAVVIATAAADTRVRAEPLGPFENGGGIWRSQDGGVSWTHATTARPSCTTQPPAAYGIAFAPDHDTVYVGTTCGLAVSTDLGVEWMHYAIVPGRTVSVVSVSAGRNGLVDVHTNDVLHGHYRSTDAGHTFVAPCRDVVQNDTNTPGPDQRCDKGLPPATLAVGVYGNHSLARSRSDEVLFATAAAPGERPRFQLYESDDQGATWQPLDPPLGDEPLNRIPWCSLRSERRGSMSSMETASACSRSAATGAKGRVVGRAPRTLPPPI